MFTKTMSQRTYGPLRTVAAASSTSAVDENTDVNCLGDTTDDG